MEDSILRSVRKVCGPGAESGDFDTDLIIHINSVLSILQQLGVGPENGYYVDSDVQTWDDYLGENSLHLNMVKSYLCAKVRLLFDPPVSSSVLNSLEHLCSEFEWRSNAAAENKALEEAKNS